MKVRVNGTFACSLPIYQSIEGWFDFDNIYELAMRRCNPGNIGHEWVKRFWIDNARDLQIRRMPESEGGMLRQLINRPS